MANEFEGDIGDIVPFKKKGDNIPIKNERTAKAVYKASNRTNEQLRLSNDLTPDDMANNNLVDKKNKNDKDKCDIIGEIVPYKKPAGVPGAPPEGGVPGGPPPTDLSAITKILEEHHTILQQIAKIEEDLKNFFTGYSATGTYFEIRTSTTVATPNQPITPDTLANPNVFPPVPGYDFIDINKQKQGQNAPKLWIIHDGPIAPGLGDNLFVITSSDGKTFSPEFLMIVGETRLINNVYEVRIRAPRAGNIVRITEREAMVPYVTTVTNTLSPVSNRSSFTARNFGPLPVVPPFGPDLIIPTALPNITIPDSFSLVVRANVDNLGTDRVFVAFNNAIAPFDINDPTRRITLAPGDEVRYTITNANLVAVARNPGTGTASVDITVEL